MFLERVKHLLSIIITVVLNCVLGGLRLGRALPSVHLLQLVVHHKDAQQLINLAL